MFLVRDHTSLHSWSINLLFPHSCPPNVTPLIPSEMLLLHVVAVVLAQLGPAVPRWIVSVQWRVCHESLRSWSSLTHCGICACCVPLSFGQGATFLGVNSCAGSTLDHLSDTAAVEAFQDCHVYSSALRFVFDIRTARNSSSALRLHKLCLRMSP